MINEQENTRYGKYGGIYMPEVLIQAIDELDTAFKEAQACDTFVEQLNDIETNYCGRPTPLTEVKNFRAACDGPRLFLKREDLLHTGAHKINNAIGQCLLAKRMGKTRIIAETGAGQHGVATATACAYFGLPCEIYMGAVDIARQKPNVEKMILLGAKVHSVETGTKTLKDAVNAGLRDYSASFEHTHYCIGSALGPYPFPQIVAFFQCVIGIEARRQCQTITGALPSEIIACIGGGSNAMGIFSAFFKDDVRLTGVEAGGISDKPGEHAARFIDAKNGVLHGCYSIVLQDANGQIQPTHSISAGLDYPMIGPAHAALAESGRAKYTHVRDHEALAAFKLLTKTEGIIPALESSHALAQYIKHAKDYNPDDIIIVNLSGRGDKDLPQIIAMGEAS
jgi:tryptophan synthase beta subunit